MERVVAIETPSRHELPTSSARDSEAFVNALFERLNETQVVYCHWKGNFSLKEALSGAKDLDLLVDRNSLSRFVSILSDFGFKAAVTKRESSLPGVVHYYGHDPFTGHLVHVHLYSSLVTGESFVPSHTFPFERMLLDNVKRIGSVVVTTKPAELVVFTLGTLVRYGSMPDLIQMLRDPGRSDREFDWLQSGTGLSMSLPLLKAYCPSVSEQLFKDCAESLKRGGSLARRLTLARAVRRHLHVYARHSSVGRAWAYLRVFYNDARCALTGRKAKVLRSGGSVIAFVGPEASGKSTLVSECQNWLRKTFALSVIHAGKPPSTLLTTPFRMTLPVFRRVLPRFRTSSIERRETPSNFGPSQPKVEGFSALIYALQAVVVAWDRRQLLLKGRRRAAEGEIVLCDRYPSESGGIDSRRLQRQVDSKGIVPALYKLLARLEDRIYSQIPPPDIVLKLSVPVEKAKTRNRERVKADKEDDSYLEFRHQQCTEWRMAGAKYIFDVDTDQPLYETVLRVKTLIWNVV